MQNIPHATRTCLHPMANNFICSLHGYFITTSAIAWLWNHGSDCEGNETKPIHISQNILYAVGLHYGKQCNSVPLVPGRPEYDFKNAVCKPVSMISIFRSVTSDKYRDLVDESTLIDLEVQSDNKAIIWTYVNQMTSHGFTQPNELIHLPVLPHICVSESG